VRVSDKVVLKVVAFVKSLGFKFLLDEGFEVLFKSGTS
jgi:hypothetical protein